jgi:hypothetical protein
LTPALTFRLAAFELSPGIEWRGAVRFHRHADRTLSLDDARLVGPSLGLGLAAGISDRWRLRLGATAARTAGAGGVTRADAVSGRGIATYELPGVPLGLDLGIGGSRVSETMRDDGSDEGTHALTTEETVLLGLGLDL